MAGEHSPHSTRRTGPLVRFWDRVAKAVITAGGVGVLAAMLGICVFLFVSAGPLFVGGEAQRRTRVGATSDALSDALLVRRGARESTLLVLGRDGYLREVDLGDGSAIVELDLRQDRDSPIAASEDSAIGEITLLYPGGRVGVVSVEQRELLLDAEAGAREWGDLRIGDRAGLGDSQRDELARTLRLVEPLTDRARVVRRSETVWVVTDLVIADLSLTPIRGVADAVGPIHVAGRSQRERFLVGRLSDGGVWFAQARRVARLDGSGASVRISGTRFEYDAPDEGGPPIGVFVFSDGANVVLLWESGTCLRYDTSGGVRSDIPLVERGRLVDSGRRVTAAAMGLGGQSLLVGDDRGELGAWLLARSDEGDAQPALTRAHRIRAGASPISAIGVGSRDRTVAVGTEAGIVELINVTSGKRVAELVMESATAVRVAALAPGASGAVAIDDSGAMQAWHVDPGFPEATWRSLFGRVHYEGYDESRWVYQSTGAPGVEPKLSLMPLIWGTLKATIVAMLIATPIAVLGAIFTSEFLHPSVRRTVKPTIELMASLPSVVLGFVAAMLVAPYVRDWLPGILVAFGVVPVVIMGAAHLWRLLPREVARRATSGRLLLLVGGILALAIGVSALAGPLLERTLFATGESGGEPGIRRWLDGAYGGAFPGWALVLVGPAAVLVSVVSARLVARRWFERLAGVPRRTAAVLELGRFAINTALVVLIAAAAASALTGMGFDTRDSVFGPFSQRNTLVVGLVMGFAVIPIIFTIADDAMRSAPDSLRSASLGAGATRWQTAVRVVLPVAGSGIFSACMIGLGRAVGETMIVLMATGNTPEMSLNIFSGFRTLAANIAVELPEAPRGGTHYRVLFLCGLVLFLMTMVINTVAELVRQSYRKRNAAL